MDHRWLEIVINARSEELDDLCGKLIANGVPGLAVEEEEEFRAFLEENRQYWDYVDESLLQEKKGLCRVTFYLSDDADGRRRLAAAEDLAAALAGARLSRAAVQDADWENNWKQFYKPMEIGDRLIVIPEWESAGVPEGRVALRLNPGLTFGTGSHATTRLCLTALEEAVHGGETVLDLGCGSGILSIAALRLGAVSAKAVDIDDKCLTVAYENAALNGIGKDRYTVLVGDVLSNGALRETLGGGYDVVVANIVADVIIGLAPMVRQFLKPGGLFLCSGIIDDRAAEVLEKLKADGWDVFEQRSSEGWFSYLCK